MTLTDTLTAVAPPLRLAEGNIFRVGNSRIPLERVVYAFNHGCAPEEIVDKFPPLDLGDVYAVIAYYLRNQEAVDEYVRRRQMEADEIERQIRAKFPADGLRERLLARLQGSAERKERKSVESITEIINGEPYQYYPLGDHVVRAIGVW